MRPRVARPAVLRALAILMVSTLVAASPSSTRAGTRVLVDGGKEFAEGELEGLALDPAVQLVPAPLRGEALESEALYIWSLARDSRGRLLAGSGDSGVIYRQEKEVLVPWARTLAFEILCMLQTDGGLLAGSSPDGVVYRVDQDGGVEVALDLPQQSVWALAIGDDGSSWIAGGGPAARLVRVSSQVPAGELLANLPATNVLCLLRDEGGLWVGTQGPGLLYRLDGDDRATPRIVFETPEDEIRSLVSDGAGGVYVLSISASMSGTANDASSRVSWIPAHGGSETIYVGKSRFISMARLPDGSLLAGEAENGRLHRIELSGATAMWAELDGGDPLALMVEPGGDIYAGTGNLGSVFHLREGNELEGTFVSKVREAKHVEAWGRIHVESDRGEVRFATRSGFRREPDESWSDWSKPQKTGGVIQSPVAPFLQYRLIVPGGDRPTHVTRVRVAYRERNLAPRVQSVRVEPAGSTLASGGMNSAPMPVSQRFEDGLQVEYSVYKPRRAADAEESAWARGLRTLRWDADDPNGDELRYAVQIRKEPDGEWYSLAEELEQKLLAWDTRAFEDGRYRVRVEANDGGSNSEQSERAGESVSSPVHVDNRVPDIHELGWDDKEQTVIKARVSDAASPLSEVSIRVGEDPWRAVDPDDGVLDGRQESFTIARPADLVTGSRLWLRATDAAGNVSLRDLPTR